MAAISPGLTRAPQESYRVDRELGQGRIATICLAHDLKHDRDVAALDRGDGHGFPPRGTGCD